MNNPARGLIFIYIIGARSVVLIGVVMLLMVGMRHRARAAEYRLLESEGAFGSIEDQSNEINDIWNDRS